MQYRLVRRALVGVALGMLVVLGSACGSDDPEAPGDTNVDDDCLDTTLAYASFGKPFVSSYCASCHGGSVAGSARHGAPSDDVFESAAQIKARAALIKDQVVVMKTMPFGPSTPKPSDAERVKFGRWLDCGAPE